MSRKFFKVLVVMGMLGLLLFSCAFTPKKGSKVKIGVAIWGYTDALGKEVHDFLTYSAKALNCEVKFVAHGFDTEKTVASIENLCASGCQGIIVCNSSDGVMPKLIKTCENNGVYLAQFFRKINDPRVAAMANKSKYYIGTTHEDEVGTGYYLGKALADKGVKNTAMISFNRGDPTAEDRYKGYKKAFNQFGIKILAEQWDIMVGEEAAKAAESFMAAYSDLQSIVVTGGSGEPLAGTISAIQNRGKTGKIQVVSTDFIPTLREDMAAGKISAMSGGHWTDPFFSFMLTYNVIVNGYKLKSPAEINMNMVFVASVSDVDDYNKWFKGKLPPYTTQEIRNLAYTYNKKTNLAALKAAAAALSLEDVKTRHKKLIK
jgi:ribose transport system substrate-binding protein